MKRNILNKLLIATSLIAMVSCKAHKKLVAVTPPPAPAAPVNKPVNPIDAIKAQQVNFNTFAAKSNATLNIDGEDNDVTLNIRIAQGKKIWISVVKHILVADIEAARALITPDSIYVINKIQSVYLKKPFSYIHTYASKQINYGTLEAMLVGNALPAILNDPRVVLQPTNNSVTLSGKLQELVYRLTLGPDKKPQQLNLSNPAEEQNLQVTDGSPVQAGNKIVPSQIDIQSAIKNKKIQVNLQYTKVDFDQQLDYPFNIPERYKPAD